MPMTKFNIHIGRAKGLTSTHAIVSSNNFVEEGNIC